MNRPLPIAYVIGEYADAPVVCPVCFKRRMCEGSVQDAWDSAEDQGLIVGEVDPWNCDDVEPGGSLRCVDCNGVVFTAASDDVSEVSA